MNTEVKVGRHTGPQQTMPCKTLRRAPGADPRLDYLSFASARRKI